MEQEKRILESLRQRANIEGKVRVEDLFVLIGMIIDKIDTAITIKKQDNAKNTGTAG